MTEGRKMFSCEAGFVTIPKNRDDKGKPHKAQKRGNAEIEGIWALPY